MTERELVTLRDYFEARIGELNRRLAEAYVTQKEFQRALDALSVRTVPREYYDRRHDELVQSIEQKVTELRSYHDRDLAKVEETLSKLAQWRANLAGRTLAVGIVGTVFVSALTAFVAHIAGAG